MQPTTSLHSSDEMALRGLFQQLLDDWGKGDGHAYGSRFTEDADYIAFDGTHTKGRQQIASSHQQLFDRFLKGTRLVGRIDRVQLLSPDIALVHATGSTVFPGEQRPRPSRDSIQTLVATRHEGAWLFTAFHNSRIQRRNRLQWILFGIATRVFRR